MPSESHLKPSEFDEMPSELYMTLSEFYERAFGILHEPLFGIFHDVRSTEWGVHFAGCGERNANMELRVRM